MVVENLIWFISSLVWLNSNEFSIDTFSVDNPPTFAEYQESYESAKDKLDNFYEEYNQMTSEYPGDWWMDTPEPPVFEENIEKDPHDYEIHARDLEEQDNFEDAIAILDIGLQEFPDEFGLLFDKANYLYYWGKNEEALSIYYEILQLYPSKITALKNVGVILYDQGKCKDSVDFFNEYFEKGGGGPTASEYMNKAQECLDKTDEAKVSTNSPILKEDISNLITESITKRYNENKRYFSEIGKLYLEDAELGSYELDIPGTTPRGINYYKEEELKEKITDNMVYGFEGDVASWINKKCGSENGEFCAKSSIIVMESSKAFTKFLVGKLTPEFDPDQKYLDLFLDTNDLVNEIFDYIEENN